MTLYTRNKEFKVQVQVSIRSPRFCHCYCCAVQVHDIVRTVDLDCDGYVSWDEFKLAFFKPSKRVVLF